MRYEVELKFRLNPDGKVLEALASRGVQWSPPELQVDTYYRHPTRDFARTDEALRVRATDRLTCLTYKGPVVDPAAKTRHEIEIPLRDRAGGESLGHILGLLGFSPVREVRKERRSSGLVYAEEHIELCWDRVPPLGDFLELEIVAEDEQRHAARDRLWGLARELGLLEQERRSYLQLLLDADAP